jgi:diacylglycerol kinase family enzyme
MHWPQRMTSGVSIIINGNAGSVHDEKSKAELARLVGAILPDAQVRFTDDDTDVETIIDDALRHRATMLVAGGGDGTINAVAQAVVGTPVVLGVLPLGTLNHFAQDLGIPTDLAASVALLRDGCIEAVDVGAVNGRVFLNNSGLGLYPEIVRQREFRQRAGASKWPAAFVSAVHALRRYRLLRLRVTVDGRTIHRRVPAILVGNNEYSTQGSLHPHRDALDRGVISLYVPRARGRASLLWKSLRALIGSVDDGEWFEVLKAESLTIESHHPALHVSLDGEVAVLQTPLEYEIRRRALRVMRARDSS